MDEKITVLLERMDEETKEGRGFERSLYHLLKAYADDLPTLNDYFHKAFRQTGVTDSAHIDLAIWQALQESKVFWHCFEGAQGEKSTQHSQPE